MALRRASFLIILSAVKLSRCALVLPRPPHSPNSIERSIAGRILDGKSLYNDKSSFGSTTSVEKPSTDNFRLLEIELRSGSSLEGVEKSPSSVKLDVFDQKISSMPGEIGPNEEKLYYLKQAGRKRTSWEPRSYLKALLEGEKRYAITKSLFHPRKKYGRIVDAVGNGQLEASTTENSLPTSSELPKQIPAPPSRVPSHTVFAHTTPVVKFMYGRSDILPGYKF
ncbi:uncharacterized protein LOC124186648 [Neodiprion fabricii]|uniref:uncharacterized protein LOC124186648 n=1 Tax=Neodiprion fabricii TaxID=2872261 RepID=UPI001ED8E0E1|nr:uncharacterized protein LOC124186648 [Neodiprion fabricii]